MIAGGRTWRIGLVSEGQDEIGVVALTGNGDELWI